MRGVKDLGVRNRPADGGAERDHISLARILQAGGMG